MPRGSPSLISHCALAASEELATPAYQCECIEFPWLRECHRVLTERHRRTYCFSLSFSRGVFAVDNRPRLISPLVVVVGAV